jgi:hypothetical protein
MHYFHLLALVATSVSAAVSWIDHNLRLIVMMIRKHLLEREKVLWVITE